MQILLKTSLRCHGTLATVISRTQEKNALGCADVHGTHTCPTAPRANLLYSILSKPDSNLDSTDSTDRNVLVPGGKINVCLFVCLFVSPIFKDTYNPKFGGHPPAPNGMQIG